MDCVTGRWAVFGNKDLYHIDLMMLKYAFINSFAIIGYICKDYDHNINIIVKSIKYTS